ncbi:MAG: energy-coupling factor transporter transmembrane protein EcfT [Coriobacteriales bacterium]|jgi:energy-coupling factor transport system permease protein|nr:energy-coupling factor transporter transmembrane protein EcfT [Coriobacteriales bacterium]
MAFDIAIGQYHHADSVIHRLDPRVKLTLLIVWIATVFCADTWWGLCLLLAFLLIVIALSHIAFRVVIKAFAPLSFLLIFPLVFNALFINAGMPLVHLGPLLITDEGLYRGVFMTLRLFELFLSATILTLTTSPISLTGAIASMLAPFERFGVPAAEIAMMISIALRFIPILMEDFDRIRKAQTARGAVFDSGGPLRRLRALMPLLIPLFAQSFHHAEELAVAMESRCYYGGARRTSYHILRLGLRDLAAACVMLALLIVMIVYL